MTHASGEGDESRGVKRSRKPYRPRRGGDSLPVTSTEPGCAAQPAELGHTDTSAEAGRGGGEGCIEGNAQQR